MISLKNTLEAIKSKISSHETSITSLSNNKQNRAWTYLGTCVNSNTLTLSESLAYYSELNVFIIDLSRSGQSYGWSEEVNVCIAGLQQALALMPSNETINIRKGYDSGIQTVVRINYALTTITIPEFRMWGSALSSYRAFVYAR